MRQDDREREKTEHMTDNSTFARTRNENEKNLLCILIASSEMHENETLIGRLFGDGVGEREHVFVQNDIINLAEQFHSSMNNNVCVSVRQTNNVHREPREE